MRKRVHVLFRLFYVKFPPKNETKPALAPGRNTARAVIEHSPGRPPSLACFSSSIDQALHLVQMARGEGETCTYPVVCGRRHRPRVEQHTRAKVGFRAVATSMPAVRSSTAVADLRSPIAHLVPHLVELARAVSIAGHKKARAWRAGGQSLFLYLH